MRRACPCSCRQVPKTLQRFWFRRILGALELVLQVGRIPPEVAPASAQYHPAPAGCSEIVPPREMFPGFD